MATTNKPTMEELEKGLPDECSTEIINANGDPVMAYSLVQSELNLIEEGQEAAEYYTAADVAKIRRWLKKWKHLGG